MDIEGFQLKFKSIFPSAKRNRPTNRYELHLSRPGFLKRFGVRKLYFFEPFRDVEGLLSPKKAKLLQLAYGCLAADEAYFEVGTWLGKSLISAIHRNKLRPTVACDDFSEAFIKRDVDPLAILTENLRRYGFQNYVTFYNEPFQRVCVSEKLPIPIGFYFYDGAHDERSQYLGIKLIEPFLSDQALVVVDDWRYAPDSQSYAKTGTLRAITESQFNWQLLYELPARYNGDRAMWWNGLAVFAFRREPRTMPTSD